MVKVFTLISTGIEELDQVIQGIWPGDNIVWQVDSIEDYMRFVQPFCRDALSRGNKLAYFRFADHKPLVPKDLKAQVYEIDPGAGFESFIAEIFKVIEKHGTGTFYVFDCLSELTADWYSDRMLANFFMLTCPYLYEYDTATYFALLRNRHTTQTITAIHNTAQVVIDIYKNKEDIFIQPLKVFKRHSKTMYMPHHWKDSQILPVTRSTVISEILKDTSHTGISYAESQLDMWNRIFTKALEIQERVNRDGKKDEEYEQYRQRLMRMVLTRDEQLLELASKYLDLSDLLDIGKHMIGTGLIGGKSVGMIIARAILKKQDAYWEERMEPHDSFYIGSDVFYTYLVMNKCWWVRWRQREAEDFLEGSEEAHHRMLSGTFPDDILEQFKEILNYYGQMPIIVRSSSLLEDAYGNSFSGKYESIFCANQGTPEERLEEFLNAVRTVYASTMNKEALLYRSQRGLLDRDEQMALLVQRVSGSIYGDTFFPQLAGVGFSYNLYVWNKDIDPKAGVLRLVFGLGTRAVNRVDDDYTRIVSVNDPGKRPEANFEEMKKHTQRKVDLLDLESNKQVSKYFVDIPTEDLEIPINLFVSKDVEMERYVRERGSKKVSPWVLTFDELLSQTEFVNDLDKILKTLELAYSYPVDIEFTANFDEHQDFKINLLQCRPYQVKIGAGVVKEPGRIDKNKLVFKTNGPIIGASLHTVIDRLIYIVPEVYGKLPEKERYEVARVIGQITNLDKDKDAKTTMLMGPGRWGTFTPALGVPVQFGDINNVSVLCEIAEMHEGLVPDVSLGTHFFNDLVELDILYLAIHPLSKANYINREFFIDTPNQLGKLIPEVKKWGDVVKVIDLPTADRDYSIYLNVNSVEQRGMCYSDKKL